MAKSRSEPELLVWNYPNGLVPLKDVKVKEPTMTDEELIARLLDAANGIHDMTPICSTILDAADRIYNLGILLHDMAEAMENRLDAVKDKAEARIIDLMAERDRAEARAERLAATNERLDAALRKIAGECGCSIALAALKGAYHD